MKNVLCFGDSNTYGYDPAGMRDGTAVRYAHDVRWCGVAQRDLGEGWLDRSRALPAYSADGAYQD